MRVLYHVGRKLDGKRSLVKEKEHDKEVTYFEAPISRRRKLHRENKAS